ncbi:hypothetical protein C8R44DRAFT_261561 [Mycena epipterygia]|nr:hypothetical protein C8R44DRAFT_261561 [Mycena epipterygia]
MPIDVVSYWSLFFFKKKQSIDWDEIGLVDTLLCLISFDFEFESLLLTDGMAQQAHLFACPIEIVSSGPRIRIEFPESGQFYWALDEGGSTRLSQKECDDIGIPRMKFKHTAAASFWEIYHYNAIREFHEAKGFDPYTEEVTRTLGLDVVEWEREDTESAAGI